MDALSEIAKGVDTYNVNERCDVVPPHECWGEWLSLPGRKVGEFQAMDWLGETRRQQYGEIANVLAPPSLAAGAAAATGAYVGLHPLQYRIAVRRMLGIGMCKLRRKVKIVNGIFGVWKQRPKQKPNKNPGSGTGGEPPSAAGNPACDPEPDPSAYLEPGKLRLIIDMRRGNCYFSVPDPVELVTPTAVTATRG
mgnify:CR=1 FL=1